MPFYYIVCTVYDILYIAYYVSLSIYYRLHILCYIYTVYNIHYIRHAMYHVFNIPYTTCYVLYAAYYD